MNEAAPWSLAVGLIGRGFVWLAILCCALAAWLALRDQREPLWRRLFGIGSVGFLGAFGCLASLFLTHQFQYSYVVSHSALDHELQYLIAGVWSGQQGSFLLWGLLSAVVGFFAVRGTGPYRRWFTFAYALFLAGIAAILSIESPFELIGMVNGKQLVPLDGSGMAPSLLNYWVVIHPPTIFTGFAALTVMFAYAVAALMHRDVVDWIPRVRPWAILSASLLGLGLCMGGFWAYETLNWGGFWMWDPVENTSFVPWCLLLAFVHGMFVQQAKKKWHLWNVLFAAAPFLSFLYGTFMTRSGFLGDTSVHSFAEMDGRALWILIALGGSAVVGFLVAFFANSKAIRAALPNASGSSASLLSREYFYGAGAWMFYAFAFMTAFGMSVPLVQSIFKQEPKVVEEALYHQFLSWVFVPMMLAMAVAPFLNWNGLSFRELFSRITNCIAISIGIIGVLLLWMKSSGFHAPGPDETIHWFDIGGLDVHAPKVTWVLFLTGLCLFVAVGSFWRMMESIKKSKQTVGAMLAHFGLGLTLLGLVFSRGFEVKRDVLLHPSEKPAAFGYELTNEGQTRKFGDRNNKMKVRAESLDDAFTATPGLYFIEGRDGEPQPMMWPSIISRGLMDYYFTLGPPLFEATDPTSFVLSNDPVTNPDTKAHKDVVLMYTGYEVQGSILEDGISMLTAKMTAATATETFQIEPAIIVRAGERPVPVEARIGDEYKVILHSMNANDHSIIVTLEYVQPAYPMQVFFKPLTLFIWLGVGIMTLGGLLSALVRRKENQSLNNAS